jgi:hypothetical protein
MLYSPSKQLHIGKAKNLGVGGVTPPPTPVPDNILRILFVGSQFRWGIINNTANYTVDYGDSTVYNGTPSASFIQQTKTYASSGAYIIDFIFNNANDYTRFEIDSALTIGYISDIINLDKKTNLNRFIVPNVDLRMTKLQIVGAGLGLNPRHELQGTKIKQVDYSGAEAGNIIFTAENMTEVTNIKIPTMTSDYSLLGLADNPLVTSYDLTPEGAFTGSTLRWSNCTNLQTITFSPTVNTTRNVNLTGVNLPNATGILDISRYQRLSGALNMPNCTWSGIIMPTLSSAGPNVTAVIINNWSNCTNLDLSPLSATVRGTLRGHSSAYATITLPTNNHHITSFDFYSCNITGVLDMSGLTGVGGAIRVWGNPLMTGLTMPTTLSGAPAIANLQGHTCNITGTLDLSPLAVNFGGSVLFYNNPNLTGVILPSTANSVSQLFFYGCNLSSFDITPLTGTLNGLSVRLDSNNLNATNVNQVLIDLDTKGWTGGVLNLGGTGNAAPTGAGITARTNLIGKGWTVTTN